MTPVDWSKPELQRASEVYISRARGIDCRKCECSAVSHIKELLTWTPDNDEDDYPNQRTGKGTGSLHPRGRRIGCKEDFIQRKPTT